jgi:phosphatidate cytidylyltransferase
LVTASFLLAKPLESVDPGPFDLRRISGFASSDPFAVSMMLALTVIIVGIVVMFSGDVAKTFDRISTSLGGIVYCCVLFGFLVLLPRNAILHLFVIIWAGDSAAYYGGRAFGAHKLAPAISPNKTVEGAVAGLVGSVILGSVFAAWLSLRVPWQPVVIALAGIAGQLGDLVESALKRSAGVKDSSTLLPGHGGILDRLDSLLFAAPVYFFLAHFLT